MHRICIAVLLSIVFLSGYGQAQETNQVRPDHLRPADVDFSLLLHLAKIYESVRYQTPEDISRLWSGTYRDMNVVEIPQTKCRYFIGTRRDEPTQEIVIRGTANWKNAVYDFEHNKVWDSRLGINLHHGFRTTALSVYEDVARFLRKDCSIVLTGNSLGAATALILAVYLDLDAYVIESVITFGQPKVTDADGAACFSHLPLLRVVDANDLIPHFPQSGPTLYPERPYLHVGPELTLLDCVYCCFRDEFEIFDGPAENLAYALRSQGLRADLSEHRIESSITRLEPKIKEVVYVPYVEREQYVGIQCASDTAGP
jgi:hypothetical protein